MGNKESKQPPPAGPAVDDDEKPEDDVDQSTPVPTTTGPSPLDVPERKGDYALPRHRVVMTHAAEDETQLSLSVWDVVTVLKEGDNGWLFGEFRGDTGWFPAECVNRNERVECVTRARSVFKAENDNELGLQPGDKVYVLSQQDKMWWIGFLSDRAGYFPAEFVEIIELEKDETRLQLEKTRREFTELEHEMQKQKRERQILADSLKLEQRLRGNVEATVAEMERKIAALQNETASAREARMKAESLAKAYESRLKEEEMVRAQLQEQILAADAKLQEETRNRMLTVMSRHTERDDEALSITAEQLAELENLRRRFNSEQRTRQNWERRCSQMEQELQLTRAELTAANTAQAEHVAQLEAEVGELRGKLRVGGDVHQMSSLLQQQVESLQSELNQARKRLATEQSSRRRAEEALTALQHDADTQRHGLTISQGTVHRLEGELTATRHQLLVAQQARAHAEDIYNALVEQYHALESQNAILRTQLEASDAARVRAETLMDGTMMRSSEQFRAPNELSRYLRNSQVAPIPPPPLMQPAAVPAGMYPSPLPQTPRTPQYVPLQIPHAQPDPLPSPVASMQPSMAQQLPPTEPRASFAQRGGSSSNMLAAATDADYVAPVAVAQQAPPVQLVTTTPKASTPRPPPSLQLPAQLPQAAETTTTALEQQVRTRQDLEDRKARLASKIAETESFLSRPSSLASSVPLIPPTTAPSVPASAALARARDDSPGRRQSVSFAGSVSLSKQPPPRAASLARSARQSS